MTLNGCNEAQLSAESARPAPPANGSSTTAKRFTVRDGFHLKTRNAEAQAALDAQLTTRGEETPDLREFSGAILSGPTNRELISAQSNNNVEDGAEFRANSKLGATRGATTTSNSAAVAVLDQLLQPENSNFNSRIRSSGKVRAALRAPGEWLIHRRRPSETQQRKQQKVDKLLHEMLHEPEEPHQIVVTVDEKRKPRCQSTLGSTYSQRVAAARAAKQESSHGYHRELLQPLTETERGLLRSREDDNKAVDKLLVSLFHRPLTPPTGVVATSKPSTPSNRFSTRRSVMRHETAVALRSHKLVSRMNELRSLPQLMEQMEALQLWKKQQHIQEHGVDIVARNRANPTSQVLQKPAQTPLLPSATDRKVHQANKRKQELDAAKEENVRRIVVRWQIHREQRTEQARRVHLQSQWLLVVALAESSKKWLTKFHEFRTKRNALVRVSMAKRLQRFWRQRTLVKRNSLQLLRFTPSTPLTSAFFRMPVVIHAVAKIQQSVRDWLQQKHSRQHKNDVDLIVTAWFEFQDVKFRRIILRFRKRVRDFQTMWRAWRSITAARIKLLLLVWAKLERKTKRRHGVTLSHPSVTFALANDLKVSEDANPKGSTLLDMLRRTTVERTTNQDQKQLEDMHRHFRNGGAVHMPISGPHTSTSSHSPVAGFQPSPPSPSSRKCNRLRPTENLHVRQDMQLRDNMTEEFQLVMYDVYSAQRTLSPKLKSPVRTPGKAPARVSRMESPPVQLSPGVCNVPVPPTSKKVPHQLKVAVLRKLLSEKRKSYSNARDSGRESWAAARKQMRTEVFRYDVLGELAAFQQLQAKYATFLLLHSITEAEMGRLIHQTQEELSAATNNSPQNHRKSVQSAARGIR